MDAAEEIKTMKLYSDVERIYKQLEELGYSTTDPLKLEDVSRFDEYHYHGTDAVDESINRLGISSTHKVLDVGSGIGGPARYLASKAGCNVEALELQEDLHKAGEDLTKRCGLSDKVLHKCGDILKPDSSPASFDFMVSWLVILHIPDRKTVFKNCFDLLKPSGKIYIEDYFKLKQYDKDDLEELKEALYVQDLPLKEEYVQQLADAGFTDIQFEDLTSSWAPYVKERHTNFKATREQQMKILGKETYDGLEYFYSKVRKTLNGGKSGGCRIVASKPN